MSNFFWRGSGAMKDKPGFSLVKGCREGQRRAKGRGELLLCSSHRRKVFGEGQDETMKRNTEP